MIPEILAPTAPVQFENENVVTAFVCIASGIPAPEITWQRSGNPFNENTTSRVTVNPPNINMRDGLFEVTRSLSIRDTMDGDSGNYSCVADNQNAVQPSVSFTFELFVRGK